MKSNPLEQDWLLNGFWVSQGSGVTTVVRCDNRRCEESDNTPTQHTAEEHGKLVSRTALSLWMRSTSLVSEASFTVVCDSESLTLLLVFLHCKTFGRLNEFTVFHKGDVNHAGLPLWKLCGRWATHVHFDFHAYTVFPCEGDEKILDSTSMPSWLIWQLKDFAPSEKVFFYSTVLMWHIWPLHHIWTHNWYCTYLHSPALKCWNVTPFVLIGYVDCEKEVF